MFKSTLELLSDFDCDSCCFAFDLSENKIYTTLRGQRALRYSANVFDTRFYNSGYCRRLEKYAHRGFAVGVPGFSQQRVPAEVNQASYLYLMEWDILVKVGTHRQAKRMEIVYPNSNPFCTDTDTMKVQAKSYQAAVVVRDLMRIYILDASLAGKRAGQLA